VLEKNGSPPSHTKKRKKKIRGTVGGGQYHKVSDEIKAERVTGIRPPRLDSERKKQPPQPEPTDLAGKKKMKRARPIQNAKATTSSETSCMGRSGENDEIDGEGSQRSFAKVKRDEESLGAVRLTLDFSKRARIRKI